MKSIKTITALAILAFMVLATSSAFAVTLTVGTASGPVDQTLQIPITVDVPDSISGAAFTLEYDTSALTVTVDSTFFDTFTNQWNALDPAPDTLPPTTVEVDGISYDQPLITNEITGMGMRVAAARCTPADDSNSTLFTLTVVLNQGAGGTTYPITVVQTVLNNTDAGYDPEGETIPVLVGADPTVEDLIDPAAFPILLDPENGIGAMASGSVTFPPPPDTDGDGLFDSVETNTGVYVDPTDTGTDPNNDDTDDDGLSDGDEVNTHGTNPTKSDTDEDGYSDGQEIANTTNPLVAGAPGGTGYDPETDSRTYDIFGVVSYDGSQTGTLYVKVYDDAGMTSEIASTSFATPSFPQPYDFAELAAEANYYLMAFIDGAGETTGEADPEEAKGTLEVAVALDMSGNDIAMEDPSIYWQTTIHAEGQDLGGVKEYDVIIGVGAEAEMLDAPPAPPEYSVKIELYTSNWDALSKDIRQEGEESYTWILAVNPHGNIGPPTDASATISWNPATFNPDLNWYYQLREGFDGTGDIVVSDMRTTTEYVVTGGNAPQYFTIEYSPHICIDINLVAGWNLVSLPVTPDDPTLTALFPDATVAYKFDQAYQAVTTLEPGIGYWVKVTTGGTYEICGQNFHAYTATLSAGWHLRGGVNGTATPATVPDEAILVMYGFDAAYFVATQFETGEGYWVKVSDQCEFTVDAQ